MNEQETDRERAPADTPGGWGSRKCGCGCGADVWRPAGQLRNPARKVYLDRTHWAEARRRDPELRARHLAASRRGGEALRDARGLAHYQALGRKGGAVNKAHWEADPEAHRRIAAAGGRAGGRSRGGETNRGGGRAEKEPRS